jgi:hypothetical protein
LLFAPELRAQVTATGLPSGSYSSLANAIADLNTATLTGPVTIFLEDNETAPAGGFVITAQGTATNTILIDGSAVTVTAGAQAAS